MDTITLKILDRLAGHPEWYRREEVKVVTEKEEIVAAWLYFYPEKHGKLFKTGRYEHG